MAGSEFLKRAQKKLLVKVRQFILPFSNFYRYRWIKPPNKYKIRLVAFYNPTDPKKLNKKGPGEGA